MFPLIFLVLVIILIVILLVLVLRQDDLDSLTGFWTADQDFCSKAGIELFWIYFGTFDLGGRCSGYVLMKSADDKILINDSVEMVISIPPSIYPNKKIKGKIKFDWEADSYEEHIPEEMDVEIDKQNISLRMIDGEMLYARLYKDGKLSEMGMSS